PASMTAHYKPRSAQRGLLDEQRRWGSANTNAARNPSFWRAECINSHSDAASEATVGTDGEPKCVRARRVSEPSSSGGSMLSAWRASKQQIPVADTVCLRGR